MNLCQEKLKIMFITRNLIQDVKITLKIFMEKLTNRIKIKNTWTT